MTLNFNTIGKAFSKLGDLMDMYQKQARADANNDGVLSTEEQIAAFVKMIPDAEDLSGISVKGNVMLDSPEKLMALATEAIALANKYQLIKG
jgi:hypothetical protein